MIQFHSWAEFWAMGKYAAYVWPSYALTGVVVLLNVAWARGLLRQARSEAQRRMALQEERT